MITGYEVHNVKGENILFLYLNYDSEFGIDFRNRHKNNNMKDEIKNFIKEKKIKFNGEKIALSFGGVVLALLLITQTPTQTEDIKLTYVSDYIVPNEIVEVVDTTIPKEEVVEDSIENIESDNTNVVDNKQEVSTSSPSTTTNSSLNTKEPTNESVNNQSSSSNNNSSNTIIYSGKEEQVDEQVPTEKQVTVYRSNGSVITLSLEEYLIGVVGAEMPASFPSEALKAQAVVARTYALKKLENGERLTDSVSTQSYKDNNELKQLWGSSYNTYYQKIKSAVESTKGLAIYYQGDYIDAVYHSTSNGKTEDSIYVWGNDIPYLKSVDSSWDRNVSSYLREVSQDFTNVLNLLGIDLNGDTSFEVLSRDNSGRVLEIRVGSKTFSGVEFRNLLGLRSADFDLVLENGNLIITTRGYGHGVGLSQYGASGMAKAGYTYDQILKHYYTGVSVY